jgi:hypothetical protein
MLRNLVLALALFGAVTGAVAQQASPPPDVPKECPPGTSANAPGLHNDDSKGTLSDKLASSKGIICPPAVDPHMQRRAPEGGAMKVVPPPGSPGGDQQVQPK